MEPLLTNWYGPRAQSPLYVIDHAGQPFEDDTLLLRALARQSRADLPETRRALHGLRRGAGFIDDGKEDADQHADDADDDQELDQRKSSCPVDVHAESV